MEQIRKIEFYSYFILTLPSLVKFSMNIFKIAIGLYFFIFIYKNGKNY